MRKEATKFEKFKGRTLGEVEEGEEEKISMKNTVKLRAMERETKHIFTKIEESSSGVCGKCGAKMASYLCSLCKHFTNVDKNPYHCEKCGICRIHADKSFQCEICNVCLDKLIERNHKCRPDSSHDDCCICLEDVCSCLLEYLSSNRNVRTELEAFNSVVPHIESNEEESFPSSAFPSPSLNSLSISLGDPLNLKKSTLASKLQEEPCEYSDEDLDDDCLAKAQSKPEIKETHHYTDIFQFKTELNGKENPDNCDSIDGVPKRPDEPLGESYECPDMHIKVQHHPQCQSSLEEMKVSAANGIGVRTPTNTGLDPFMLSAGISSLQELEQEQDKERCANHVSINMMDNDPLSMESVGTNDKEGICVPNSPNKSGQSSDCSKISVSSSGSLVAQGKTVCSSSSSQGSSQKSAKAPEVALTTRSAVAPGEIANESNLNTGGSEEEVPAQAQLLNSTNDLTDGGNIEVGDIEGQSLDLCYGASGTSRSNTRSPLSDSYAFCPLADPENSHVDDGNLVHLQQRSNAHGQTTLGMHGSNAASSSSTDWECLGTRPKSSQTQHPLVAISPPPAPLIGSPVSVGLAGDLVVRHSQDKAVHESLFANGRDFSFLGNDTSHGASFVEGSTNASEAYRVRPCFGACQAAVGNNSYVRPDGNAFSHVPSSGFERARLLSGISSNESLYGISPPTAAVPLPSHTGPRDVTFGWNGSSSDGANNVDGFLNIADGITGQRHYNRGSNFPYVQHNTHVGQAPLHWCGNAISGITPSGFAYGLTSSGFTFGPLGDGAARIRLGQLVYATRRHVVSDGGSAFIDEQAGNERSHNADLAFGHQSLAIRHHEPGTSAGCAVIVDNNGLPSPFSFSACSVSSRRVVSAATSRPPVVSASNTWSLVRNSSFSTISPGDGNASGTRLTPVSGNANENNSRGALFNGDNGTNNIEPVDDSLLALERRVADTSSLVEQVLREREDRQQFAREIERREPLIRERRQRERGEREEREIQEVEEQEQEAFSSWVPMAL